MRILIASSVFMMIASAFALYAVNYETRGMADAVRAKERDLEKAQRDIAILKAERAHLARPDRIAAEARKIGLAPARHGQFAPYSAPDPINSVGDLMARYGGDASMGGVPGTADAAPTLDAR